MLGFTQAAGITGLAAARGEWPALPRAMATGCVEDGHLATYHADARRRLDARHSGLPAAMVGTEPSGSSGSSGSDRASAQCRRYFPLGAAVS